ncbi:uncharacterized protein DDB_G0283697-like [Armigeres subalbatus]|uniref:uncharacterized protein DDB_G0283697-like n=1 Tax=Armigeres subalbatus TaxID=124917 RepID=UPI002ED25407
MGSDSESVDKTLLDLTGTPCGICGPSTCDEKMVGCDGCSAWFHIRCVGLPEEKLPRMWYCQNEACRQKAQEYQKQKDAKKSVRSRKQVDESDKYSTTSRTGTSSVDAKVRALEQRQKRQMGELEAEMELRRKEKEIQRAYDRKKMEEKMRAEEEEKRMAWQAEMLRKKKEQIQRMEARQKSFEMEMAAMDERLAELSGSPASNELKSKIVASGLRAGPSGNTNRKVLELTKENVKRLEEDDDDSDEDDEDADESESSEEENGKYDEFDGGKRLNKRAIIATKKVCCFRNFGFTLGTNTVEDVDGGSGEKENPFTRRSGLNRSPKDRRGKATGRLMVGLRMCRLM